MAVKKILLLGNPKLYEVSEPMTESDLSGLVDVVRDLHDTMMDFRTTYGRGRAIAAPQIGVMKRLVYMHIDKPVALINPVLDLMSDQMIDLWDDCMSFPELVVRVRRHRSCRLTYRDETWAERHMDLEGDLSELIQHEVDHLDGVLAVQRAIDDRSFALARERGTA
jgi:peptide deformylase